MHDFQALKFLPPKRHTKPNPDATKQSTWTMMMAAFRQDICITSHESLLNEVTECEQRRYGNHFVTSLTIKLELEMMDRNVPVYYLETLLRSAPCLKEIQLWWCQLTGHAGRFLHALSRCQELTHIEFLLCECNMSPKDTAAFGRALASLPCLCQISMVPSFLGQSTPAWKIVLPTLETNNHCLERVELKADSWRQMFGREAEMCRFLKACQASATLKDLCLETKLWLVGRPSPALVDAVVELIAKAPSLERLVLSLGEYGSREARQIIGALKHNQTLKDVQVQGRDYWSNGRNVNALRSRLQRDIFASLEADLKEMHNMLQHNNYTLERLVILDKFAEDVFQGECPREIREEWDSLRRRTGLFLQEIQFWLSLNKWGRAKLLRRPHNICQDSKLASKDEWIRTIAEIPAISLGQVGTILPCSSRAVDKALLEQSAVYYLLRQNPSLCHPGEPSRCGALPSLRDSSVGCLGRKRKRSEADNGLGHKRTCWQTPA